MQTLAGGLEMKRFRAVWLVCILVCLMFASASCSSGAVSSPQETPRTDPRADGSGESGDASNGVGDLPDESQSFSMIAGRDEDVTITAARNNALFVQANSVDAPLEFEITVLGQKAVDELPELSDEFKGMNRASDVLDVQPDGIRFLEDKPATITINCPWGMPSSVKVIYLDSLDSEIWKAA